MQLNSRLLANPPSLIREIGKQAAKIPGSIALTIGEPDLDAPFPVARQISEAILSGDTHYPPNAGIEPLRAACADFVNSRFHSEYHSENALITIGSTEALASALFAILNPGDEVIVPVPAFGLYKPQIELAGGVFVPMDISSDDFEITESRLSSVLSPRTRAILFASPNNPTGTVLSPPSLSVLKSAALAHDLYLIADSVYDQLIYISQMPSLCGDPDLFDRLIYVSGLSKAYAMTGVRLGYALADARVMTQMIKAHSFLVVSAPGCIQTGCKAVFETDISSSVQEYKRRRDLVCEALLQMHLPFKVPSGAFYIFPDISSSGLSDWEFCSRLLNEQKLALIPSQAFGTPNHVRISYCYSDTVLNEGLHRLSLFLKTL